MTINNLTCLNVFIILPGDLMLYVTLAILANLSGNQRDMKQC